MSMRSRPGVASRAALGRVFDDAQHGALRIRRASATSRCFGVGVDAPGGDRLVTTGTPIAMASRILFCVPRAMASGATISAEPRMYGRTSGTEPVTVTPAICPSRRIAGDGSAPTMSSFSARPSACSERQRRCAEVGHAFLVRVVVHPADEADGVGVVAAVRRG